MRLKLSALRRLLREAYEAESYKQQLKNIIERHAAPHTYCRFDDRKPFSKARSFKHVNPNQHTNHAGLWMYMIEPGANTTRNWVFGYGGQWVTILRATKPSRVLRTDQYTEETLEDDIVRLSETMGRKKIDDVVSRYLRDRSERLQQVTKEFEGSPDDEYLPYIIKDLRKPATPFEKLESLVLLRWPREQQRQFYLNLGYVGIEDPEGIIDTTGWTAVFFDPSAVKVVKRYRLQDAFDPEAYDKEEADYWEKNPKVGHNPPDDLDPYNPGNWPSNDGDVDPPYEKGFYYDKAGNKKPDPRHNA